MSFCAGRLPSLAVLLAAAVLAGMLPSARAAVNDSDHDHEDHKNETDHHDDDHDDHDDHGAHGEEAIFGQFEVQVAEDQENNLKDPKVIEAFEKAYAEFVGVADTAVHVMWVEDDHSGHGHRRLRRLQSSLHHQAGEYEIKMQGLDESAEEAAVAKLKLAKTSGSKANELKSVINRKIAAVPGFTSLQVQKVEMLSIPVVKEASTPTKQNADFAKQSSCPWMHYSWFTVALFLKSLI